MGGYLQFSLEPTPEASNSPMSDHGSSFPPALQLQLYASAGTLDSGLATSPSLDPESDLACILSTISSLGAESSLVYG